MRRMQFSAALVPALLCAATMGFSPSLHGQDGLFSSNEPVEFVLEANWDELDGDRDQESEERPGQVHWTSPSGEEITIPIEVKTRGNFRLRKSTCSSPPLRLDFPGTGTEGTLFHGQDKIKLVSHCRNRDNFEQNLLEEYLAYRIYNLLTDISFRVRLARITYVDSMGNADPVTRMAFLIEDEDAMADRLGAWIWMCLARRRPTSSRTRRPSCTSSSS